jgi:hypothetical protein
MFNFCMNLMYVIICRLCFVSQTVCILCLFYKLNADYAFYPAVTDELMSASPSLLWTLVATDR